MRTIWVLPTLVAALVVATAADTAQLGPRAAVERAQLAQAVLAAVPDAEDWSVRSTDSQWVRAGIEREIYIDLPAPTVAHRVGKHETLYCKRMKGDAEWSCSEPRDDGLVEIRSSDGPRQHTAAACPWRTVRGIEVDLLTEPGRVVDLVDFVRSADGQVALQSECTATWEHWRYSSLETCEVAGVRRQALGGYRVTLRLGHAHWLFATVLEGECSDGECQYLIDECDGLIA